MTRYTLNAIKCVGGDPSRRNHPRPNLLKNADTPSSLVPVKIKFDQFEQLVSSKIPADQLYAQFIQSLVTVTSARAGGVWICEQNQFRPMAYFASGQAARVAFTQKEHQRVLSDVIQQQRSAILNTPKSADADSLTIFAAPLKTNGRVVELVFAAEHPDLSSADFIRDLNRVCQMMDQRPEVDAVTTQARPAQPAATQAAGVSIQAGSSNANQLSTARDLPAVELSQFVHALHQSIDLNLTCSNVVNETRRLLDCDRVSVLLKHRGNYRIRAISGQYSVNRRSNTVKQLETLAAEILKTGNEFWYPAESEIAPQLRKLLDQYLTTSTTRSLVVHPIAVSQSVSVEDPEVDLKDEPTIAGIVYEHFQNQWDRSTKESQLRLATEHSRDAIRNAVEHSSLFLYPFWRFLGKTGVLTKARNLPKTLAFLLGVSAVLLFLIFWPSQFYVVGSGVLVPQNRKLVFPHATGEVVSVLAKHGQLVQENQPLVKLKNEDLQLRIADTTGKLDALKLRKSAIERSKFQNSATATGANATDENLGSLQAEIEALERQQQSLFRIEQQLDVLSPMSGQVITWDVDQKLEGRSVSPQNVLMEVAEIDGPWQVELDIEDRKIEHLLRGLKTSQNAQLQVRFTLAADPSQSYNGVITQVANSLQLDQEHRQMLRVKVDLDSSTMQLKQARTGVVAKIYTGETTSVGYLWLHEIPRALKHYITFYFVR